MVVAAQSADGSSVRIVARGNFSLDAGGLSNLLLALAAVTLGLAAVLAWQGFWPILLIAALQVVLVSWILVRAWERGWVSEVIVIDPDRVAVTHQRHRRQRRDELPTGWAVVEMRRPEVAWYAPRLVLRSGRQVVELGRFLTVEEKQELAAILRRALANHSALQGVSTVEAW